MTDITQLLSKFGGEDDRRAADELLPLVYQELRNLAAAKMAHEGPEHTLSATSLVHEAYIRLVDRPEEVAWQHRGHFFAAAAEAMRRILIDRARAKGRIKRGGGVPRVTLIDEPATACEESLDWMLDLDQALTQLAKCDPLAAELFKLRYFGGCSIEEAGQSLGLSRHKAHRNWTFARAAIAASIFPET